MIQIRNLRVQFQHFRLGPLDLSIAAGERVALVGSNGAGKSTTLKTIAGLLPGGYSGSVRVQGNEVREVGPAIRHTVGLLPEELAGFGWMTVSEHLRFLQAFYPAWDADRANRLCARLELPPRTRLANLSKGTRVKLSLVAVEAHGPAVVLLDEPTAGVDPLMREDILRVLRDEEPDRDGRTVVFSSHILEDVECIADRVLLLREGRLVADLALDALKSAHGPSVPAALMQRLRPS